MSDVRLIGPVYEQAGLRLQDVDAGCGSCGKRLCVVIDDSTGQWNRDDVICLDEGIEASLRPYDIKPSYRAPGRRVAVCKLCSYTSMPTDGLKALEAAQQHYQRSHSGSAA